MAGREHQQQIKRQTNTNTKTNTNLCCHGGNGREHQQQICCSCKCILSCPTAFLNVKMHFQTSKCILKCLNGSLCLQDSNAFSVIQVFDIMCFSNVLLVLVRLKEHLITSSIWLDMTLKHLVETRRSVTKCNAMRHSYEMQRGVTKCNALPLIWNAMKCDGQTIPAASSSSWCADVGY